MPGRVLVVDDVASNRVLLRARLTAAYYDVVEAADGEEALSVLQGAGPEPDLVLLDVMMPGIDGYEVCRRIKSDPKTLHIPVIMLTALGDSDDRVVGLEAGADDFLTKPFDDLALFARVSSLTRMKMMVDELRLRGETSRGLGVEELITGLTTASTSDATILAVTGPNAEGGAPYAELATALDCRLDCCGDEEAMREMVATTEYDAFILDDRASGADALRLCAVLRTRPETRQAAIVMLAGEGKLDRANVALEIGANDYAIHPVEPSELTARLRSQLRRKRYADQLRTNMRDSVVMAVTDHMTGVYNRRYAEGHLDSLIARSTAQEAPMAAMMLDLDKFKSVNDTYGHAAGDMVIKEFARRVVECVRPADLVARMGGEEFLVVLPDVSASIASEIAERVRAAVERPSFTISEDGQLLDVTVSIGLAMLHADDTADGLIHRADLALYESKNGGRNRVTLAAAA